MPPEATKRGQSRVQSEKEARFWDTLVFWSGVLWGSQAKARLANSNQKEQGFDSSMEASSKAQKAKAVKVGETVKHRVVWGVISRIYIYT